MRKFIWTIVLSTVIGSMLAGCKSAGSREFIPGRGWRTTEASPAPPAVPNPSVTNPI